MGPCCSYGGTLADAFEGFSVILRKMYLPAALAIGSDFWRHALSVFSDKEAMLAVRPVLRFLAGVIVIGAIASNLGPDDLAAISSE